MQVDSLLLGKVFRAFIFVSFFKIDFAALRALLDSRAGKMERLSQIRFAN